MHVVIQHHRAAQGQNLSPFKFHSKNFLCLNILHKIYNDYSLVFRIVVLGLLHPDYVPSSFPGRAILLLNLRSINVQIL